MDNNNSNDNKSLFTNSPHKSSSNSVKSRPAKKSDSPQSNFTYSNVKDSKSKSLQKHQDLKQTSSENLLEKILSSQISAELPNRPSQLVELSNASFLNKSNQQTASKNCPPKQKYSNKANESTHNVHHEHHPYHQHHHQVYLPPNTVHYQQESFSLNHFQNEAKSHQHHLNKQKANSRMKNSQSMGAISYQNTNNQILFEQYWDQKLIDEGLTNKTLIQGKLRINQRSYEDAYITDPDGGADIFIKGMKDRNRALNNDIVAVKLKEKYLWKILDLFKTKVVDLVREYICENKSELNSNLVDLVNKLSLEKSNENKSCSNNNKNNNNNNSKNNNNNNNNTNLNKNQDEKETLIDLAPLCFSKPDLLAKLDDKWFQRTGIVVGLLDKKNTRYAAGHLKLFADKNTTWALFSPNDSRVPRMRIKMSECPRDFLTNSQFYANTLFIARIVEMPIDSKYVIGELKKSIGNEGDIEAETEAILIENGIDYSEFDEKVNNSLPKIPWSIPDSEYAYRRDLRKTCIFTIDPATARDLDDALHCIRLDDDVYEVGVHIADVSYFVHENSPIDLCAAERTTSVYLVQKVIPMLPRLLCEELCSLNPLTDRLTFSVIWKMNSQGEIIDEWFGRTVINSACKLSYEHAQMFIEEPEKRFEQSEFPPIRSEFQLNDQIKNSVLNLHRIAQSLRAKRFGNGCLALNQVKISFVLNREEGCLPYGYQVYQQKESNRLVEEFMLLANIAVAKRIYDFYPNKAILRRHPPPNTKQIEQLAESMKQCGFAECDVTSSHTIQTFLKSIEANTNKITSLSLICLLSKCMQLALYFCTGTNLPYEQYYHYGLAVPLYTHFTSPIRRYPDILVHRLLGATLSYNEVTKRDISILNGITENCNDKKYAARQCSEKSAEIFFSLFVNECGPFEEVGCVTQIKDHSFDVLIVNLGITKRVYTDKLEIEEESIVYTNGETPTLTFTWKSNERHREPVAQKLELFSNVVVVLMKHESDRLKFNMVIKHPNDRINQSNTAKLIEKIEHEKELADLVDFCTQRVDFDPYICD